MLEFFLMVPCDFKVPVDFGDSLFNKFEGGGGKHAEAHIDLALAGPLDAIAKEDAWSNYTAFGRFDWDAALGALPAFVDDWNDNIELATRVRHRAVRED